ncbi:MAG: threonine dehydratase [Betaproteobacteria bacterium]|nr:threonine dehydratase [Betaproteobacteria bacterium]
MLPSLTELIAARNLLASYISPTPQYPWPLLCEAFGGTLWMKHENHLPTGAFKLRGGLVYCAELKARGAAKNGIVTATRGNHGQSIAYAAGKNGLSATIVVPEGNSAEKNAAMRALGAELIVTGHDFQAASEYAEALAQERNAHKVPAFHHQLIAGVASYTLELFEAAGELDAVFVPIGMGSGASAVAAARNALGLRTRIIGVVSAHATAYAEGFRSGTVCERPVSTQLADGLACRATDPQALAILRRELDDILCVSDTEVAAAMRLIFSSTHNVAEGAGAAALAGAIQVRGRYAGRRVGVVLTGGNVDSAVFARVLQPDIF